MRSTQWKSAALSLAAAALLAASGGGGGDAGTPVGNFDVNTGLRNLLTGARNFALTGSLLGMPVNLTIPNPPGADVTLTSKNYP